MLDVRSDQWSASSVIDLVAEAQAGDASAWEHLVARYQPLVNSVTRRCRLSDVDAADVSQTVWVKLLENLANLREPRALPGWILTTTTRASLRVLAAAKRIMVVDP